MVGKPDRSEPLVLTPHRLGYPQGVPLQKIIPKFSNALYPYPLLSTLYPLSPMTQSTINVLCQPTSTAWLEQALGDIDTILLDHSHCERKAAATSVNLMFRYPSNHKLVRQLTAIAREELEHFEQVNQILEQRGIPLAPYSDRPR